MSTAGARRGRRSRTIGEGRAPSSRCTTPPIYFMPCSQPILAKGSMIVHGMSDPRTTNYYDVLHLSPTATEDEIKAHYRKLSKQYHPDMGGSQDAMAALNEAYNVLSDRFRRSIFDAERRRAVRVPEREPSKQTCPAEQRQPAPRPSSQFRAAKARKTLNLWSTLAWGFAVMIIVGGIIMQLPVAWAAPSAGTNQNPGPSSQQDMSYQSGSSIPISAPSGSSLDVASSNNSATQSTDTCANDAVSQTNNCYSAQNTCTDDAACQEQSQKNCVTKTFGLYKHVVCSAPGGSNSCTSRTLSPTYRYTNCY